MKSIQCYKTPSVLLSLNRRTASARQKRWKLQSQETGWYGAGWMVTVAAGIQPPSHPQGTRPVRGGCKASPAPTSPELPQSGRGQRGVFSGEEKLHFNQQINKYIILRLALLHSSRTPCRWRWVTRC